MVRLLVLLLGLAALSLSACAPSASAPPVAPTAVPAKPAEAPKPAEAKPAAPAASPAAAPGPALAARPAEAPRVAPTAAPQAAAAPAADAAKSAPASGASAIAPVPPRPVPTPAAPRDGSPQLPIVQNLGRMIIYTTEMTILVQNVDGVANEIGTIALAHGGYVAGIETRDDAGLPTTIVRLKVPPANYEAAMRGLRGLAVEVRAEKATTQDVTEEYSDVQTQLASLEATHAQLLEIMKRSGSVEEVLKVQQQAAQIKLQIDRLKGRATALERLSDLATITVTAQAADVAVRRDYTATRAALRKAEATRANLETQLRRARPEEQDAIRDRIAEALLEIARLQDRVADLEAKAARLSLALPTQDTTPVVRAEESLPDEYLKARAALRRAQEEQSQLMLDLRAGKQGASTERLREVILEVTRLTAQRTQLEERARQLSVTLPQLTAEQEAALAGVAPSRPASWDVPAAFRGAWEASLTFLATVASGLIFLWWILPLLVVGVFVYRRRVATTRRAPGAPATPPPAGSPAAEV